MKVLKIKFKNFRSYGNSEQLIELDNESSLIAIDGESGSGKTIIKEVFEYSFFGKVVSRRNPEKTSKLKNLPNRRNKNLITYIEIEINNKILSIERGMSPNIFKVIFNHKEIEDNKQIIIERLIGLDSNTYQSFISFSQSDILNFISLTKSSKDNIINKLFNYEYIIGLSKKIQILSHSNNEEKYKLLLEKNQLIKDLKKSENKIDIIEKNKNEVDISKIEDNKKSYESLKNNNDLFETKETEITKKYDEALKRYYEFKSSISNINEKMSLYEKGVCPYCKNELKEKEVIKKDLEEKYEETIKAYNEVEILIKKLKDETLDIKGKKNIINKQINEILIDTKTIKNTINIQKKIALIDSNDILEDIKSFEDNINETNNKIEELEQKDTIYSDINSMISLDGDLKKEVLKKALPKVNQLINKYVTELDFEYDLEVLNNLKVNISQYGVIIDNDDPSNGEIKRANLIIMFAFMTYSALNNKINFMFLDELLEGLDIKSTNKILKTLKHVSSNMNINMFLICHKLQDFSQFDKIIKVEKNYFSTLSITKNFNTKNLYKLKYNKLK